ncbi:MAG: hypothetical protein KDC04_02550 [Saprospiraceae bacterium]|nr:hypothetical protein [Saprospiraceae bacterium]MCB9308664.1 hypothetical protein [Lewinellaceae bacterium]
MHRFFVLYFIILFTSCQEDSIIFIPDQTKEINRDVVFSKIIGEKPYYFIPNIDGKYIQIADYLIKIDSNTLRDNKGNSVNNDIRLEFTDFTEDKLHLLSSNPPKLAHSSSEILHYFRIAIYHGNDTLYNISSPIEIYILTPNQVGQDELFYSFDRTKNDWYQGVDQNNIEFNQWNIIQNEQMYHVSGYKISLNSLKSQEFCIVKNPIVSNQEYYVKCTLTAEFDQLNTLVYFVNKEGNSFIPLQFQEGTRLFTSSIPSYNKDNLGDIVVFSDLGEEKYYFGTTNAVIGENTAYTIQPKKTANEDIKAKMLAL